MQCPMAVREFLRRYEPASVIVVGHALISFGLAMASGTPRARVPMRIAAPVRTLALRMMVAPWEVGGGRGWARPAPPGRPPFRPQGADPSAPLYPGLPGPVKRHVARVVGQFARDPSRSLS